MGKIEVNVDFYTKIRSFSYLLILSNLDRTQTKTSITRISISSSVTATGKFSFSFDFCLSKTCLTG